MREKQGKKKMKKLIVAKSGGVRVRAWVGVGRCWRAILGSVDPPHSRMELNGPPETLVRVRVSKTNLIISLIVTFVNKDDIKL